MVEGVAPIVTLTLNPALDVSMTADAIEPWRKVRCANPEVRPGGGGVNVARTVRELGGDVFAIVALGGHVGSLHADAMRQLSLPFRRVSIRAGTRQNFAVTERSTGRQYRFVYEGARLSPSELNRCIEATCEAAVGAAAVVASGSAPPGVSAEIFGVLAQRLAVIGTPLVVDTSGPALTAVLREPVLMVKPSVNELATAVGRPLEDIADLERGARSLMTEGEGAEIMVVSRGAAGALVVPRGAAAFSVEAPVVPVAGTTGAGDSMVGAMVLALTRGDSLVDAARLGVAAGTAAVMTVGSSLCARDDVLALVDRTVVT
jgi:6-phosphofructokinase 2